MNCEPFEESMQIFSVNFNIQSTEMSFHNVAQGGCKLKQTITNLGKKFYLDNKSKNLYYKHFTFIYNFNGCIVKYFKA